MSVMRNNMSLVLLTGNERLVSPDFSEALSRFGSLVQPGNPSKLSAAELGSLLAVADVAVTGWGSPMLPPPLPGWRLRYVCHMTGEMKRCIPEAYLLSGIVVTNWGDAFSFCTAEAAMALLFAVLKDTRGTDAHVREKGRASYQRPPICSLYRTRVGIYGLSTIGRLVAGLLLPFGAEVSFYDPTVGSTPPELRRHSTLESLFAWSEIVTVHAGLNDATRHSVDFRLLSLLPPGGIFVNTARGAIVVEADLARILGEGRLRAGIDVIEEETDWRKSPLAAAPNTVLTGHVMSQIGAREKPKLQEIALGNIERFAAGLPLQHVLTAERYRLMT